MAATVGSVDEALSAARAALRAAGTETPGLDAELLLAEATGMDRARMLADSQLGVDARAARRFGQAVRRRAQREPVAYILGRKGFRHIELAVDPRVLIPRPETELLVEYAVERGPATVLDVGTGSGAVALAVADELAGVAVIATDTSPAALDLARANAAALGLADRVEFIAGSYPPGGSFDLVLANLPYVSEPEWHGLAPEIARYEPRRALVAGPTGLEAIEGLLGDIAVGELAADAIALEVGAGQAPMVEELLRRAGLDRTERRRDLAGIERVVVGRR
jgi:release factor glutamine methyltransferase